MGLKESALELVEKMRARDCTNGWDLMCCYDEKHVNDLLKEKYEKGEMIANVHFEVEETIPFIHYHYKAILDMILEEPLVRFNAAEKERCELTMVIGGGTLIVQELNEKGMPVKMEEPEPQVIPANVLQIKGNIPISGVSGGKKPQVAACYPPSTIIQLTDEVQEVSIILNFSHEEAQYMVEDVGGGHEKAKELLPQEIISDLKEFLSKYFVDNIDSVEYKIGGITTLGEGYCGMYPKSFIFAFSHGGERNTLNLYVQIVDKLEGNGRYQGHRGDLFPSFQPRGKSTLPIPDGFSASLILSHELMEELYFRLEMEDLGWKAESLNDAQAGPEMTEGIAVALKPDVGTVEYNGAPDGPVNWKYHIDIGYIDFTTEYIKLILMGQDTIIEWAYDSGNLAFKASVLLVMGGAQEYHGKIRVTGSCRKTAPIRMEDPLSGDIKWEINLKNSDFHMEAKITERDDESLFGRMSRVPEQFKNKTERVAQAAMPSFHVSMKSINAFLLGSILFPGTHVFKISDTAGCYAPRDFIIFGNLEDHLDRLERENKRRNQKVEIQSDKLAQNIMTLLSDPSFAKKFLEALQDEGAWDRLSQEENPETIQELKKIDLEQTEEIKAVAAALENQDISWWSGVYQPEAPEWMKGTKITVTGANDEIMVGEEPLPLTKEAGKYVWTYQSKQFNVIPLKEYDNEGAVSNAWLEGQIDGTENSEYLKAKKTTEDFSSNVGLKDYLAVMSVMGSFLTIKALVELMLKCVYKKSDAASEAKKRLEELKELEIRRLVNDIRRDVEKEMSKSELIIQENIDKAIAYEVDCALESAVDPSTIKDPYGCRDVKINELASKMKDYKEMVSHEVKIAAAEPIHRIFKLTAGGVAQILQIGDEVKENVMQDLCVKMQEKIEGAYIKSVIQNRVDVQIAASLHNKEARLNATIKTSSNILKALKDRITKTELRIQKMEKTKDPDNDSKLEVLREELEGFKKRQVKARYAMSQSRLERDKAREYIKKSEFRGKKEREEWNKWKKELKF